MTRRLACALLLTSTLGCATMRARPGEAEARFVNYSDDNGLDVTTVLARAEQPLSERTSVFARALADHIVLTPRPLHPPHQSANQPTGHFDSDVVTSASSTVANAAGSDKWRFEGTVGGQHAFDVNGNPSTLRGSARVSSEPDYGSMSALLRGSTEVAQRSATLSASLGFGHDRITPFEPPPGQDGLWPATHDRVVASASIAQILSPSVLLSAGLAATFQRGVLANPYRRAVVRTTLFPESVPDARSRYTAFLALSWHLGAGTALHLREGAYADSWGVRAFIPEVSMAKELGPRFLAALRYRYYAQSGAEFYQAIYPDILPVMTGDARLGNLREHAGALSLRWTPVGRYGELGSVTLFGEDEIATLRYDPRINLVVGSNVLQLGVLVSY